MLVQLHHIAVLSAEVMLAPVTVNSCMYMHGPYAESSCMLDN